MEIYSIGGLNTELEIALEEYKNSLGDTPGTDLLARVTEADDAYGKKKYSEDEKAAKIIATEQWARWESEVEEEDIQRLLGVVHSVSECSFENGYFLARILHAAAIRNAGLNLRLITAITSGNSAMHFNKLETAKAAFADAILTLRLSERYLNKIYRLDVQQLAETESEILKVWQSATEPNASPLDLKKDETAVELIKSCLWDTDKFTGSVPRVDATARMVIRLEHWIEVQAGNPKEIAEALEEYIETNAFLKHGKFQEEQITSVKANLAAICADALVESGNAVTSFRLFELSLKYLEKNDPFCFCANIRNAAAHYFSGDLINARNIFLAIDFESIKKLSEFILTMQGEFARYIAVSKMLDLPISEKEEPIAIARSTASTLIGTANGRLEYLRVMYSGHLMREIEAYTEWRK